MYAKFGRISGGAKKKSFPPPRRPPSSSSRPHLASKKVSSTPPLPPPSPSPSPSLQFDESYSLVSGDSPAFASIIRLAPDVVDEIKRVESHGGAARIKFDFNPNNSSANVIDVGGKEYRFTWSHEIDGLCDIYEERQIAVDGNGLLVESACLSRKLNVRRVLDESTKKQVKKRSEEYEQKQKSRKAIVLDRCNPLMKRQVEALAAVDVGGHPKAVKPMSGSTATVNAKIKRSNSSLPSPLDQPVSLASAFVRRNAIKSQNVVGNSTTTQGREKENVVSSQNDYSAQTSSRMPKSTVHKDNKGAGMSDLENMLVNLLKENEKGMSLKALEKAVGDMTSNSVRKIEPILKKISTFEPPGRYMLKSGIELESFRRSYSVTGRSSEDNNLEQFVPEDNNGEVLVADTGFAEKSPVEDLVETVQKFDESNVVEIVDASQHFSNLFGDDGPHDYREGQVANSIDNDSDSTSRSRSRSPEESGNACSSDSKVDDSSTNSKEASDVDVDVDIMIDDNKKPKKLQGTLHGLSASHVPRNMPEGRNGDQDGYASSGSQSDYLTAEKVRAVSFNNDQNQPTNRTVVNRREDVENEIQHEQQTAVKFGGKFKTGSKDSQLSDNSDRTLRRFPEAYPEDGSRPCGDLQPQLQRSWNGHAEVGSLPNKAVTCGHLLQNETIGSQGTDVEGYGETQKRSHITSQCETSRQNIVLKKGKRNKSRKPNGSKDSGARIREGSNARRNEKRKRSESFSEENNLFSKYAKKEPELKESIKSFSQYKLYVKEYREKYESYCSLHQNLETFKNEFQKWGMDLDYAKGRDEERYYDILAQLRESYDRCGLRHKQLKKIFIVLHEELKHLKQMIKDFAAVYMRE